MTQPELMVQEALKKYENKISAISSPSPSGPCTRNTASQSASDCQGDTNVPPDRETPSEAKKRTRRKSDPNAQTKRGPKGKSTFFEIVFVDSKTGEAKFKKNPRQTSKSLIDKEIATWAQSEPEKYTGTTAYVFQCISKMKLDVQTKTIVNFSRG